LDLEGTVNLTILQAGEKVLRAPARALSRDEILAEATQKLVEDMRETVRSAPGVGLAAPQVGVSVQLVVIEDREEYHAKLTQEQLTERHRRPVPFHVLINPQIVAAEDVSLEFFEGCLSVNGYTAIVPRNRRVTVEFLNEQAEPVRAQAEGWYARILQHEIDHLRGYLYIDRMHSRSFCSIDNFERLWKDLPTEEARRKLMG
jgi:peptide deformylase